MTDIFQVKIGIAPELMKGVLKFADIPHNLWNQSKYDSSIPCTGPKPWEKVPKEVKKFQIPGGS